MKIKRFVSMFLCLCIVVTHISVSALATELTKGTTGDCIWQLEGTVLTISGNGEMENYTHSKSAPWGTNITEVLIEEGVTSIGNYSFYGCRSLTSARITQKVATIGNYAFAFCSALKSLTIPSSIKVFGNNAFYYCSSLPGIIIPNGATSIGDETFSFCSKFTDISIPPSVNTIGDDAFQGCSLKSVTIPDSVTSLGTGIFSYCNLLTAIVVDENNPIYYSSENCIIQRMSNALISGCKTSIIPDGVVTIADSAFNGINFVNIEIPNTVTTIGRFAYAGSVITGITIPNSVTDIKHGAFYLCKITDIYYSGNKINRANINIAGSNESLMESTWHYAPCEDNSHIYDYDCTTICDVCEYARIAESSHTYDNNCDNNCNICNELRIPHHTYVKNGENTATCSICGISKTFDFIISTDETITLSYEAKKAFSIVTDNTAIAKIGDTKSSVISIGSNYSQSTSALVLPIFPGETTVSVIATNGSMITSSSLLVVEGEHQLEFVKILNEPTHTETGTELHKCKFCEYEEEKIIPVLTSLGDVNLDNKINSSDALLVLKHSVKAITLTDREYINADVNKDNLINSSDALKILQYAVGSIDKL